MYFSVWAMIHIGILKLYIRMNNVLFKLNNNINVKLLSLGIKSLVLGKGYSHDKNAALSIKTLF